MSIIELIQIDKKYNEGRDNEVHALRGIDWLLWVFLARESLLC